MNPRPGEDLDHQLARLTLVLENAPVILYGLDLEGRFIFSEGDGIAAMGLKKGQIIGNSAFDLYRDSPGVAEAIRAALAGQHAVFRAHFAGAHFVSRLTPVIDSVGVVEQVVGVSVDIGGQVRAEEELSQRDDQLRQSQKMEAVGQLAGGIAHDFNNLLTAIIGYSDLLLESDENCPFGTVRGDVEEIRRAGERAAGLTRQILAFSRRQPLQPETICLNDVLAESEPLLRRTLGEQVELDYALDPELGFTELDPHQLEQVITNLAINARDAMPGGGTLSLRTANVEVDEDLCWLNSDWTPGPHVMLTVSDTGVGMDKQTLSQSLSLSSPPRDLAKGLAWGFPPSTGSCGKAVATSSPRVDRARGPLFGSISPA